MRLIASALLVCASLAAGSPHRVVRNHSFDLAPGGTVRILDSFGEVRVEGWDQPRVEITLEKSYRRDRWKGSPAELERKLERARIEAYRSGDNTVEIRSWIPMSAKKDLEVEYRVKVPRRVRLVVEHGIGEVEVRDVVGDLDISASIGEIQLHLSDSERWLLDGRARIGEVDSSHGGEEKRSWLVGGRLHHHPAGAVHRVKARVGIGEIQVRRLPASPSKT